jgi:hypothetical protein
LESLSRIVLFVAIAVRALSTTTGTCRTIKIMQFYCIHRNVTFIKKVLLCGMN